MEDLLMMIQGSRQTLSLKNSNMINEQTIREIIEQCDPEGKVSQATVEEIVARVKEFEINPPKDGDSVPGSPGFVYGVLEEELKKQIMQEPDWRKKAALAAKIISINL